MQFGRRAVMTLVAMAAVAGIMGAPVGASAQQVFELDQLTDKPRIAAPMAAQRAIEKAYPRSLLTRGVGGKVMLQFVLGEDGKVDVASIVVQSADHGELAEAAKQAMAHIEFVPGRVDGQPVQTRVVFPISFVAR